LPSLLQVKQKEKPQDMKYEVIQLLLQYGNIKYMPFNFLFPDENAKSGQVLVTLLFFVIVATIITSASVAIVISNSAATGKFQGGTIAYNIAESGAENALIRLLRDPNYAGENLTVDGGTASISAITSGSNVTIISTGTKGSFSRKVQVVTQYNNGILSISSWQELP
jgi:hypothetical protein